MIHVVKLGWTNLHMGEKAIMLVATFIAVLMAYQSVNNGTEVMSVAVFGPLMLLWVVLQSTFYCGIIRGRSRAMNYMFVELMKELRDARQRLGEEISEENMDLVARFLGDKE